MNAISAITTIPVIATIVYTIIDIIKTACGNHEKFTRFIPLVAAGLGAIIGLIAHYCVPGLINTENVVVALVIGAASGLSATGTNQIIQQLTKPKSEDTDETTEK